MRDQNGKALQAGKYYLVDSCSLEEFPPIVAGPFPTIRAAVKEADSIKCGDDCEVIRATGKGCFAYET